MTASTFGTVKRKSPLRSAALAASWAAVALAAQPAVAEPVPLMDWNPFGAPTSTSGTLTPCPPAAPSGQMSTGAGEKGRAHGMYQFIKYGSAPPPSVMSTWKSAADCVAGTPPPPVNVVPTPQPGEPESSDPLPPPPALLPPAPLPQSPSTPVEEVLVSLTGNQAEVPPHPSSESESTPPRGQAVPEPASGWLLGMGLLAAWGTRRRRAAK